MEHKPFVVKCVRCLSALLSVVLILASCETWKPEELRRRTVLVYMSGDNDLWPYMSTNIRSMAKGMSPELSAYNSLVVFVDKPDADSYLLNVRNNVCDTVKVWDSNLSSSSPDVLSMVIDYVTETYPAMSYGMVVSSHGSGWIPAAELPYVDPYKYGLPLGSSRPVSLTKAVCCEITSANKMRWMEVGRMAEAISDGQFDFILLDACLMMGVETLCELPGKTKYVIGSSVEIMSDGFPYSLIVRDLFEGNYAAVCRKTFEYYNSRSGQQRTCGVALVDVDKIVSLGEAFKKVVDEASADVDKIDIYHGVQRCDRYKNPVMFDLRDVAELLGPGDEAFAEFDKALSECVTACYHTDYVVSELKLEKYCGLSCYLPVSKYDMKINPYFADMSWNKITGFLK